MLPPNRFHPQILLKLLIITSTLQPILAKGNALQLPSQILHLNLHLHLIRSTPISKKVQNLLQINIGVSFVR